MSYIKQAKNPLKMLLRPSPVQGGVALRLKCALTGVDQWAGERPGLF